MRVRVLAPGLAAAGLLAVSGCGSDGTATVTVTTGGRATVAADPATTSGRPASRSGGSTTTTTTPSTTTVVRTTTRTTKTPALPTERPIAATTRRPAPTTPTPATDPDPLGGTVPSSGRIRGTGYSVTVPAGWNDGSRRFEGDENAFDINLAKRPGADLTSSIFTDHSRPTGIDGRPIGDLAAGLRQDIADRAPSARITRGPDLRVDDEDAVSFVVRRSIQGTVLRQRQVLMVRGPVLVVVRLTSPRADFADDSRVFARFLASWRWD